VPGEQFKLPLFSLGARGRGHGDVLEGDAVKDGQVRDRTVVGDDEGNLALQLARPPAEEQIGHAVQVLRAEQSHPGPAVCGGQFPAHVEFAGQRRELRLEGLQIKRHGARSVVDPGRTG